MKGKKNINESFCIPKFFWQMLCHFSQTDSYIKFQVKGAQPHSHCQMNGCGYFYYTLNQRRI